MGRECAVSEFDFGMNDMAGEPSGQDPQGPKWFREYMDKVSGQLKALQERNEQLEQVQRQTEVAESLKAKGYAPEAAKLFTGDPTKLDDWIGTYGAALAKTETAQEGGESQAQVQAGPPATVVSPESQAAMTAIAGAGTGGAGPLSGDDQIAARLASANTEEEFAAVMREAGNVRFR